MVNTRKGGTNLSENSTSKSLRSRHSSRNVEQREKSSESEIEENDGREKDRHISGNGGSDSTPPSGYKTRRVRRRPRKLVDDSDEDDVRDFRMSPMRKHQMAQRRSSRSRRKIYDTLNADLIMKSLETSQDLDGHHGQDTTGTSLRMKEECSDVGGEDMYSRIKRHRIARGSFKVTDQEPPSDVDQQEDKIDEEQSADDNDDERDDNDEDDDEDDDDDEDKTEFKSYNLRERRQGPQRFQVPLTKTKTRTRLRLSEEIAGAMPPNHRDRYTDKVYRSPAHRRPLDTRKKAAFHGSSTTSSSDDDDDHFERRKAKSMIRARNRCLPMNLSENDVSSGPKRDRAKIGSSLADVDPMTIDRSVTFESVGGLGKHIRSLKEMVIFPLLYPEMFEKFKISPPRGVLFYGPPGTGKTLVARALANESSHGDTRVAFFMRKGADCLSKWVGESERQLRLLFDQAYQMRPSIIFFDEIDGLAPVRSSRQDQIHSSIVSTLLALMDGLDGREEIVVIGATNRIDSIDPALRRPGRFDREFMFPLPSLQARMQILAIHTKDWSPTLSGAFIKELAERCVGYCGADLKSLCTEAALVAMRRRYPQIYTSSEKLELNLDTVRMSRGDFLTAMATIVPTARRSVTSPARSLEARLQPLLGAQLTDALRALHLLYPAAVTCGANLCEIPGSQGQGQTSHLGPAILHRLERLPVYSLDLPALYAVSAKTPEESCAQIFQEARRTCPSVIYLPRMNRWWDVITDTVRATFLSLIHALHPTSPILILATTDCCYSDVDEEMRCLFHETSGELFAMRDPDSDERTEFFRELIVSHAALPPMSKRKAATRVLEVLPKAAPPRPRELTDTELQKLRIHEEETMRELRIFLRDVLNKILNDKKLMLFAKPVNIEDVPDYYDIIRNPMDLGTMMSKIDQYVYMSVKDFLADIDLICSNALEYNPDTDASGRMIRHRACSLRDTAHSIVKSDLDPEFEKICHEVIKSMKKRGESPTKNAPPHVFTRPAGSHLYGAYSKVIADYPSRYSRRLRGMEVEPDSRVWQDDEDGVVIDDRRAGNRSCAERLTDSSEKTEEYSLGASKDDGERKRSQETSGKTAGGKYSPKKRKKVCIWAKPQRKRRRVHYRGGHVTRKGGRSTDGEGNGDEGKLSAIDERSGSDAKASPDPVDRLNVAGSKQFPEKQISPSLRPDVTNRQKNLSQIPVSPHTNRNRVDTDGSGSLALTNVADLVKRRHSSPISKVMHPLSVVTDDAVMTGPKSHSPRVHGGVARSLAPELLTILGNARQRSASVTSEPKRSSTRMSRSPARYTPPLSPRDAVAEVSATPRGGITDGSVGKQAACRDTGTTVAAAGLADVLSCETHKMPGDSGISSSLESNGDSRDSIDHGTAVQEGMEVDEAASGTTSQQHAGQDSVPPSTPTSETTTNNTNNSGNKGATFHVTRRRSQSSVMREAIEILETPEPPLVVDHARLSRLLAAVVDRTDGYSVERLEKLHCVLGRLVHAHRRDYDKTLLIEVVFRS